MDGQLADGDAGAICSRFEKDEGDPDERGPARWTAANQSRYGPSLDQGRRRAQLRNFRRRSHRPGGDELRNQSAAVLLRSTRLQPRSEEMNACTALLLALQPLRRLT